ncbi:MAG: helicase C-terminal domain-containing protein, partial [Candidatus Thermoplasmatota archaeon]|nr:helicase C-terminal domain-containing protein [Candidatus Thermoplasmatota archaeon]
EAFKECRGTPRIQHYLMLLQDVFNDFSKEGEGELDKMVLMDLMGAVLKASISPLTYDEFSSELRKMGEKKASRGEPSASVDVADFLDLWAQDLPSAVRIYRGGARPSISYRLLDPSHMASPIFEGVHSSLLMSGTLYPMKMYRDLLGLETRRTILKEYLSPFPKSNRPIFMDKGITTKFSERGGEMYDMLASNLGKYISRVPGNVAVFFQSYGMLQEVGGRLDTGTKDRWTESSEATKEEKDLLLGRLLRAKKGEGMVVLGVMGASMAEGIDYKDNALEMVVVVGIPLAPPNLETKLLTEFYTNLFGEDEGVYYGEIQPAMNKVLQAAGRAIRSAEDRAVVILMDNRFGWHRYKKCFPHDFNITPTLDVEQAIEDFFSA